MARGCHTTFSGLVGGLGLGLALLGGACGDDAAFEPTVTPPDQPPVVDPPPAGFEPASPAAALAKVKNLMTGLAPTDGELAAVTADDKALRGLVDGWMGQPAFRDKMLGFFQNAFQQGQISAAELSDQLPTGLRGNTAKLVQNVRESFPRTAWQLVEEGRPFHETVSTRRFMLTPALAAFYTYLDNRQINDRGGALDRTLSANPQFSFRLTNTGAPIPLSETLDPLSPNYMKWYHPTPAPANLAADCKVDPRVYTANTTALFGFLFGSVDNFGTCPQSYGTTAQITDAEYDSWRMVTIRPPAAGESATAFYNLPALRGAKELVLRVPRVGFFSTPAFFANWATNASNQARVTMNQTLIVAMGKSFDDSNNTVPITETALDGQHAGPGTSCYGCHRTLDPMRQAFRQAFTLSYHEQLDPAQNLLNGVFAFGGVSKQLSGIYDLADTLAEQPRFAAAWTQKLCNWANSAPCGEEDPEFLRVAAAFQDSGYNFKTLVRELFTSPLVTARASTRTFDEQGVTISIARRDAWCASLSARLSLPDVCGLNGAAALSTNQRRIGALSSVIPSDGYSRGAETATVSTDPNLFFRASTENICRVLADQVVDAPTASRYSSKKPQEALPDLVGNVMGLPPADGRAAPAQKILAEHHAAAIAAGKLPVDALKSTFMLACMAPSSVGSGL